MAEITPSKLQNKKWRKAQSWYINGKHNECEIYQKNILQTMCKIEKKTGYRLRKDKPKLVHISNSELSGRLDKFEFTEDFDYIEIQSGKKIYYNLKMVCDKGGAQTRTISLVYDFIKAQLEYLTKSQKKTIYFVNILDGDTSSYNIKYFHHLLRNYSVSDHIFIGDMYEYRLYIQNKK